MSLIDAFSKEDRVPVTFTDFFNLVKQAAKYENVMNGVKCDVPHRYIRECMTGEKELTDKVEVTVHFGKGELEEILEEITERVKRQVAEEFGIPIELLEDGPAPDADQEQEEAALEDKPPITGEKGE